MMSFEENIDKETDLSLDKIKQAAKNALPEEFRPCPWNITCQGGSDVNCTIYTEALQLNAYLASYTDWHKGKLDVAFNMLSDELPNQINIIDWACGQGMATLFVLDYIKKRRITCSIGEVVLIEPSTVAVDRAEMLIKKFNNTIKVRKINKKIDDVEADELRFEKSRHVFQMFSNILDIAGIDLRHLTQILYANDSVYNTLICVSPFYYSGNVRIDSFFKYFNRPLAYEGHRYLSNKAEIGYTYNIGVLKLSPDEDKQIIEYKFYPPVQFRAAYESSAIRGKMPFAERLSYYDVYAPFDLGASVSDDVHPILAVLNNLITRGLPTNTSAFVENVFCEKLGLTKNVSDNEVIKYILTDDVNGEFRRSVEDRNKLFFSTAIEVNEFAYSFLGIARIQKLLIEILISGKLSLDSKEWDVLVEEKDVPCAALAFEDFRQMFDTLTAMSIDYADIRLPKVNLTVVSNPDYNQSSLHLNSYHVNKINEDIKCTEYDLVIHYTTQEKNEEYDFSTFKAKNNCYFAIFSSAMESCTAKRCVYTTDRINYKPFVYRNEQGLYVGIEEQVEKLTYFLNLLFRKKKFRNGQLPILTRALANKPVIGLLPTGGGKSITYQLAAMLQPGITIVIDPLVSLMKDQYEGLIKGGIDCCTYINSTVNDKAEREEQMEQSKVQFVFMSPERLCISEFRTRLKNMYELGVYFSYGVIDEVHCVSEWGHDFRFTYLHLGRNLYKYVLPKKTKEGKECLTLFGLTATASFDVLADVERELSGNGAFIIDSDAIVRYENTNRLELQYRVVRIDGQTCNNKWDVYEKKRNELPNIIKESADKINELLIPENISKIKKCYIEREAITDKNVIEEIEKTQLNVEIPEDWCENENGLISAIVFCPLRQGILGVRNNGRNNGIATSLEQIFSSNRISTYVGGDVLIEQEKFIKGETSIMVATKAFGMGIDKPNVRFTYNVNFSGSLEAFVQEAGRAGRDRKMALATILYCPEQFSEQNSRTRLMEHVTVDYGVHKFFFENNFIGKDFEKHIMYYLMTKSTTIASSEEFPIVDRKEPQTVIGFLKKLMSTKLGYRLVFYISYSSGNNSVEELNEKLIEKKYPKIVFKEKDFQKGETGFVSAIEKAIYRMCCIGVIDDYTRDYQKKRFRIVTIRKPDDDYYKGLKSFLMRYFTEDRADEEIQKARSYRGDCAIQKCLGYITDFVYDKIATKRERAIHDMEEFCNQALNSDVDWIETNENLKDFIYYYFNSKFARQDYQTEDGRTFSLTSDTEQGKKSSYEILFKFMDVVDDDIVGSSGSPKDNVKHLQGAVRLIRRSLTDSNPTLDFLNVFCLLYLKQENERIKKEFHDCYMSGYKEFKARTSDHDEFYDKMSLFNAKLKEKKAVTEIEIERLERLQQIGEVEMQTDWLNSFKEKYTE